MFEMIIYALMYQNAQYSDVCNFFVNKAFGHWGKQKVLIMKRQKKLPLRFKMRLLKKDNRGVSALEFALTFPVFIMFMVGTLEVFYFFTGYFFSDAAVQSAARVGMTGYDGGGSLTREQYILAHIREKLHFLEDDIMDDPSANKDIDMTYTYNGNKGDACVAYVDNDDTKACEKYSDDDGNCAYTKEFKGPGVPGALVIYTFSFDHKPLMDIMPEHFMTRRITVTASSMNEQFPTTTQCEVGLIRDV